MKANIRLTCLILIIPFALSAQNEGIDMQKMVQIPPSPEAAGFIQYGNTDINYHLGRPNISVPIYSHQGREMGLPITLSYSASGIKTQQMASNVGLGWTLIGGGAITRIKIGMADDDPEASSNDINDQSVQALIDYSDDNSMAPSFPHSQSNINKLLELQDALEINAADTQSDIYSFSASTGLSGRIYYDYGTEKAYSLDDPTLKILADTSSAGYPEAWYITDASGIMYEFTKAELTQYEFSIDENEYTSEYTSAWFLSKIISPNGKDVYQFNYQYQLYWQEQEELLTISSKRNRPVATGHSLPGGGLACPVIPTDDVWSNASRYKIRQQTLKSISWNGLTIANFTHSSVRSDLPGGEKVSTITIYKGTDSIKNVNLHYSYFGDEGAGDKLRVRLKLDSVVFQGNYGTPSHINNEEVWSFEYDNPDLVPSRATMGVDYWGFYNGKDSNSSLVPSVTWGSYTFSGADRSPDITKSVYGSLTKINFPTGGSEKFYYEGHDDVNVSETIITTYELLGSLVEGSDANDPYDFCFSTPTTAPNAITGTIEVSSESVGFKVNVTGGPTILEEDEYVLVYLFPDDPNWDHCHADTEADNENGIRAYMGNQNIQFPLDTLAEGTYRYLVYNSFPNSTATLSYAQLDTLTNTTTSTMVGGFRIAKIESKDSDGSVVLTREFDYDDEEVHRPLNFIELKTSWHADSQVSSFYCNTFYRYSNNRNNDPGKDISYGQVKERITSNGSDNGYRIYTFLNNPQELGEFPILLQGQNDGKLIKESLYDLTGVLLRKTENFYSKINLADVHPFIDGINNMFFISTETVYGVRAKYDSSGTNFDLYTYDYIPKDPDPNSPILGQCEYDFCEEGVWSKYSIVHYDVEAYFAKLDSSKTTEYFNGDSVLTEVSYLYDQTKHFQLIEQKMKDSNNDIWITKNYYPDDVDSVSSLPGVAEVDDLEDWELDAIDLMKTDVYHQINRLIQTEKFKEAKLISRLRNNYQILSGGPVMMESVENAIEGNSLEKRVEFVNYDSNSNPEEIRQIGGHSRSFIWAYDAALPVIQGDNISASGLQTAVAWAVTNMTNKPTGVTNLETLLEYIGNMETQSEKDAWKNFNSKLREHTNINNSVMLIARAFNSMHNILAQTDPNGTHVFYEYDGLGRLKTIRDTDNSIINTYQYHYKGR